MNRCVVLKVFIDLDLRGNGRAQMPGRHNTASMTCIRWDIPGYTRVHLVSFASPPAVRVGCISCPMLESANLSFEMAQMVWYCGSGVAMTKLYEQSPTPILFVAPLKNVLGRA